MSECKEKQYTLAMTMGILTITRDRAKDTKRSKHNTPWHGSPLHRDIFYAHLNVESHHPRSWSTGAHNEKGRIKSSSASFLIMSSCLDIETGF